MILMTKKRIVSLVAICAGLVAVSIFYFATQPYNVVVVADDAHDFAYKSLSFLQEDKGYKVWYISKRKADNYWEQEGITATVDDVVNYEDVKGGMESLKEKGLNVNKIHYIFTSNQVEICKVAGRLRKEFKVNSGHQDGDLAFLKVAKVKSRCSKRRYQVDAVVEEGRIVNFKATERSMHFFDGDRLYPYLTFLEVEDEMKAVLKEKAKQLIGKWHYHKGGISIQFSPDEKGNVYTIVDVKPFSNLLAKEAIMTSLGLPKEGKKKKYQGYICVLTPRATALLPKTTFLLKGTSSAKRLQETYATFMNFSISGQTYFSLPTGKHLRGEEVVIFNFSGDKREDVVAHVAGVSKVAYPINRHYVDFRDKDQNKIRAPLHTSLLKKILFLVARKMKHISFEKHVIEDSNDYIDLIGVLLMVIFTSVGGYACLSQ